MEVKKRVNVTFSTANVAGDGSKSAAGFFMICYGGKEFNTHSDQFVLSSF